MPPESDTATESTVATEEAQPQGSKQPVELPKMPSDPANDVNKKPFGGASRRARMAAIEDSIEKEIEEASAEKRDKHLGLKRDDKEASELEDGVEVAEAKAKADPKADAAAEEKRREARRNPTKEPAKAADAAETDEIKVEEPAAEEEAKAEEVKAEDAAAKQEKERKAKFEKVLKMEADARKRDDKLRSREEGVRKYEADLKLKERNLEENYKRAIAANQREIQTARQVLKLAREAPLELLERSGAKPEDVGRWVHEAEDPTAQRFKQVEGRFAELERREREMAQRETQQREEAQRSQTRQSVEKQYLGHFDEKDGEEYVFDAARLVYSSTERLRLGNEIADAAYAKGMSFTSRDIAEAVDAEAKEDERWKVIETRAAKAKAAEAGGAVAKAAVVAPKAPVAPKPTVVATNAVAALDVPPKDKDGKFRKLTPGEQRALRNRRLIAGLGGE